MKQKSANIEERFMSDNFHVDLRVEIYDQWEMAYDKRGDLILEALKKAIADRLKELGIPEGQIFISGSVY